MAITKQKVWTYEDYYQLDDDKRYEVIEGELIEMAPAPRPIHQIISIKLASKLLIYSEEKNIGQVIASPIDVIFESKNSYQPDIVFISNNNQDIIKERGIFGSPDLVVEILSPSTAGRDRGEKFKIYEKFRVNEYWIVDPDGKSIEIFSLEKNKLISYCSVKNDESLKSKIFSKIELSFNDLNI